MLSWPWLGGDPVSRRSGACGGSERTEGAAATQKLARDEYFEGWEKKRVLAGTRLGMEERKTRDDGKVTNP